MFLSCSDIQMQEADAKPQAEPEAMLNYEQYYPTQLPLRQPGMEETETEAHAQDDRPPDLSLHRVRIPIHINSVLPKLDMLSPGGGTQILIIAIS